MLRQGKIVLHLVEPFILERYFELTDRERLARIRMEIDALTGKNGPGAICETDDALHRTITDACDNKYLNISLYHMYDQAMRIRVLAGRNIWSRHKAAAVEHMELISHILDYRMESAKHTLIDHLNRSKKAAIRSLIDENMPIYHM